MKLLQSKRMKLPLIYLSEKKDLDQIPMGIPYIIAREKDYDKIVRMLEYEILLKSALATGLPFKWDLLLRENGFTDPHFIAEADSNGEISPGEWSTSKDISDIIADSSYVVDIEYIKNLKLLPTWFCEVIEEGIKINILNTILYNPNLYNKKLGLMTGGVDLTTPEKNLIIIDISGSIPTSISNSMLLLSKTMSTSFYADLLITGSKSTIYNYDTVDSLDIDSIYRENGMDNDQKVFMGLLKEYKKYDTVIVFGDNHSPLQAWRNEYNKGTKDLNLEEAKNLCKWDVKRVYSFHTTSNDGLAGYGVCFNTTDVVKMKNWVKYLKK